MVGSSALRSAWRENPLRQALGARGQHVVLAERLQHRRADDQRVLAVQRQRQRQRGQQHVRGRRPCARRRWDRPGSRRPAVARQHDGEERSAARARATASGTSRRRSRRSCYCVELGPASPGRQTPVTIPITIATEVPSATIGIVFADPPAGCPRRARWLEKETPRFPCASSPGRSGTAPTSACRARTRASSECRSSGVASGPGRGCGPRRRGATRNRKKLIVIATKTVANAKPIRLMT